MLIIDREEIWGVRVNLAITSTSNVKSKRIRLVEIEKAVIIVTNPHKINKIQGYSLIKRLKNKIKIKPK